MTVWTKVNPWCLSADIGLRITRAKSCGQWIFTLWEPGMWYSFSHTPVGRFNDLDEAKNAAMKTAGVTHG